MDRRDTGSEVAWGAQERLPGARMALAGAQGADAITWISRVAIVALTIAVMWWAWALVRPLPTPDVELAVAPPVIPTIPAPIVDDAKRAAIVEGLARENLYAADHLPWVRLPMASAAGEPADGAPSDSQPATGGPVAPAPATTMSNPGTIAFTPAEKLPEDVRKALATLELKAVRAESSGAGVAMISFVHSATRQQSTAYRRGDEFTDEANPGAAWRVEAVDLEHRRVLLQRAGVVAALPLYKGLGEGPTVEVSIDADSSVAKAGLQVERRTRDEVIMDLRMHRLSEADIQAVIEELDRQLAESGESPVKALGGIIAAPDDVAADKAARRAPPAGMEAVLQMMSTQSKDAGAKPEAAERPRRGKSPPHHRKP